MKDEYRTFFAEAEASPEYWAEVAVDEFTRHLSRRMRALGISSAVLARRVGTTKAQVTDLLRGTAEVDVLTLTRLASAVGGVLHIAIRDPGPPEAGSRAVDMSR